jgi:hypothetical protein
MAPELNELIFYYIRLYEKAERVILSCKSLAHVKAAKRYCHLYFKVTGDFESFTELYHKLLGVESKIVSPN